MNDKSIAFTIDRIEAWNSFNRRKWLIATCAILLLGLGGIVVLGKPWGPERQDKPVRGNRPDEDASKDAIARLVVTSSAFESGGSIPIDFTGDGASASPPIAWSGAPEGTKSFAVNLWHIPGPGSVKSYWVVYNIPLNATKLDRNDSLTGTLGINDKNHRNYDPMKSKGPGLKHYHITVYALSEELPLSPDKANRANLLAAIKNITLAEGTLDFQYERQRN